VSSLLLQSQSKEIMQILSDHYPERLGIAMLMDAPFIFHGTYKLLQPFIPHKTKEKACCPLHSGPRLTDSPLV
jgi:hypothetical protein